MLYICRTQIHYAYLLRCVQTCPVHWMKHWNTECTYCISSLSSHMACACGIMTCASCIRIRNFHPLYASCMHTKDVYIYIYIKYMYIVQNKNMQYLYVWLYGMHIQCRHMYAKTAYEKCNVEKVCPYNMLTRNVRAVCESGSYVKYVHAANLCSRCVWRV